MLIFGQDLFLIFVVRENLSECFLDLSQATHDTTSPGRTASCWLKTLARSMLL